MGEAKIGLVLDCADPEAVAAFWEQALGVKRLGAAADPEGNEFCVCDAGSAG